MRKITSEDIRNPRRKSGYDHVRYDPDGSAVRPYRAGWGTRSGPGTSFHGPRRATAREAAQDYCDHINGSPQAATPALKSAGHTAKRDRIKRDPEVQHALGVLRDARGAREGEQGYVYMIGEDGPDRMAAVKIGFSTNPEARVAELQTGNPRPLALFAKIEGTLEDEAAIHARCIEDNILGEWFRPSARALTEFGLSYINYLTRDIPIPPAETERQAA